jgi:PAS domain-containing protein
MLGSMTDGLVILDREWRFVFANDQALAMFDRSRSYLAGKTSWEVFPTAEQPGAIQPAQSRDIQHRHRVSGV